MSIRVQATKPGVTNEYGQPVAIGQIANLPDDYAKSLVMQQRGVYASVSENGNVYGLDSAIVAMSPEDIAAPSAQMLASPYLTFASNVSPYGRWQSNGTRLVPQTAIGTPFYSVMQYGAKVDGRVVSDGTMLARTGAGATTVGSATIAFSQDDVGKRFAIHSTAASANYGITHGYILSVESATSATVYVAASVTAITSAGSLIVVTDDSAAVVAAISAATATGGDVFFPPGICGFGSAAGSMPNLPAGVNFAGAGNSRGDPFRFISKGSTLTCVAESYAATTFVTLSGSGCAIRDMNIDCARRHDQAVEVTGTLGSIKNSTIARGVAFGVKLVVGSALVQGCHIYNNFAGIPLEMVGDTMAKDNYIYGSGDATTNINVNSPVDDVIITGNHIYKAGWGITPAANTGPNIRWYQTSTTESSGGVIANNTLDTCEGHHIDITVFNSSASAALKALTIAANQFYQPQAFTTNTYACIKVKVGSGGANNVSLRALSVTGNVGKGYAASSRSYLAFILWDIDGVFGTVYGDTVTGNSIDNCNNLYSGGHAPNYTAGNTTIAGTGTVVAVG